MSQLDPTVPRDLAACFVDRLMDALEYHAVMASPAWVSEGLDTLNAYRRVLKDWGERTEEEQADAETRALEKISEWAARDGPPKEVQQR